jgi:para-nitrobenzyl esterase
MMILLFSIIIFSIVNNSIAIILQTTNGPVRGFVNDGVATFFSVPFAEPPVGALRFRPPQPIKKKWTDVLDCTTHRSVCPQGGWLSPEGDEDCLTLDIYMPESLLTNHTLPLSPAMIWIYGGGFTAGSAYFGGLYDATRIVRSSGHVHVAMNYRLGAFGFLALDELLAESNTTGNYGLLDQNLAMQWVRDNTPALRIDSKRVTLFGESAGAFSVCWHLVAPISANLFTRAIMESANCDSNSFFVSLPEAKKFAQVFLSQFDCDTTKDIVTCARSISTNDLVAANFSGPALLAPMNAWGAAIDGRVLFDIPTRLIEAGKFFDVPVIAGTNQDEGVLFVLGVPSITGYDLPLSRETLELVAAHFFGSLSIARKALAMYDYEWSYEAVLAQAITDWFFVCSTRRTVRHFSNAWVYHDSFVAENWVDNWLLGTYHSAELEFVFRNPWPPVVHWFTQRDALFSDFISNYWLSFASSSNGEPNNWHLTPQWPSFNMTTQQNMRFDWPAYTESFYRADICTNLWDKVRD